MCEKFFKSVDVKYRPMLMSFTDVKQTEQALQMLKGTVVRVHSIPGFALLHTVRPLPAATSRCRQSLPRATIATGD